MSPLQGAQGHPCKYQANGYAAELDNVGVGDGIEAADPGVKDGDQRRYDHGGVQRDLEDHSKRCAWCSIPIIYPSPISS